MSIGYLLFCRLQIMEGRNGGEIHVFLQSLKGFNEEPSKWRSSIFTM